MAGINDYSNTAGSNTTINGIDIAEGCSPAGINNAIRQLMADIADMDDGVVPLQTPDINGGTIDGATIGGSSTIDNSIIGGTTPAAGTFTNLTATGTLTGLLGNVVEDVTPQLGGDLDLNSNDITGTGNINITGTATVSGDLTVDTNTLKVDSSNNVVMVGLTSSLISNDAKLQVAHTNGNADIIVHRAGDNANPPSLNFQKTRNASIGNYGTIVQNNDELGSIRWGGADGSNIGFAARIVGAVDGTPGANDMPGRLQFHTSPDGTENLTERMRIDSSGNVGIGTSSPATKTHIFNGSDNANILFIQGADTTTENIFFGVETGKSTITAGGSSSTNNSLVFRASNAGAETEYMRITNTGNVGIGTSSPTSGGGLTLSSSTTAQGFIDFKHTVDGDSGYIGNAKALITGATTNQLGVRGGTNGIAFGVGATEAMRIDSSGNVGIGNIPETWYSTFSALQIGANKSAIYGRSENNQLSLASNSYVNASGNNTYINSSEASLYEQNSGIHKFFTAPSGTAGNSITFTERMRISSDGLHLGGTGSANALDDYEEGTWTPTLDFLTSSTGSLTYVGNTGFYVKVGRSVFITAFIQWNANNFTASSGALQCEGLPFTTSSTQNYRGGVAITFTAVPWTGETIYQQAFRIEANTVNLTFNFSDATDGAINSTISNYTSIQSIGSFMISGTYLTDS